MAFITSKIPENILDSDILIASDDDDFVLSGLHVSSTLRLHRMMTVTVNIVRRELGTLSEAKQAIIKNKLQALFNLA